jgi:hypothetical protein
MAVDVRKEILDALREWGIDLDVTQRVIIELSFNDPPIVHIQQIGDKGMLGVVKSIRGDVRVVRESRRLTDITQLGSIEPQYIDREGRIVNG